MNRWLEEMQNMLVALKEWPMRKKVVAASVAVVAIALLVLTFSWSQREEYQILFTNLSEADAGQIAVKLKDMNIPYRAEATGIFVPRSKVYDARLQLASQGLPQGGGVGFEIFDQTSFGTTEFVQKLNYKRALQGELARTIMAMNPVEQSRVHLAIPERSLFVREGAGERPTASVLVRLHAGRTLSRQQVDGIVHLVASSVEGLDSRDVTVVDTRGNVLSRPSDDVAGMSASQFEFQNNFSREMETRITYILEPVVGKGKVRARVSTELNMSREETTQETFDPDGQVVRSEQRQSEKSTNVGAGGIPGVASNLPQSRNESVTPPQSSSERQNQTVNYEISRVTSRTVNGPGRIKKVTAAVLVDGTYVAKEGSNEKVFVPRSEEDLKRYEQLIREAIGFTEARGDQVRVVNMPFEPGVEEEIAPTRTDFVAVATTSAKTIVPLLVVILLFLFVLRPIIKSLFGPDGAIHAQQKGKVSTTAEGMADDVLDKFEPAKEISLREQISEWARNNPQEVAGIIKGWVR